MTKTRQEIKETPTVYTEITQTEYTDVVRIEIEVSGANATLRKTTSTAILETLKGLLMDGEEWSDVKHFSNPPRG
jgi:hypothetical protein